MSTRIEAAFVLSLAVRERAPTSGEREDLVIIITRWWSTCTVIWQFIQCIDCCCGNVFLIRKNCFFFGCCSCLFVVHRSLSRALMSVPDPLSLTDLLVILIHILYQQPRPLPSDASHTGSPPPPHLSLVFIPSVLHHSRKPQTSSTDVYDTHWSGISGAEGTFLRTAALSPCTESRSTTLDLVLSHVVLD